MTGVPVFDPEGEGAAPDLPAAPGPSEAPEVAEAATKAAPPVEIELKYRMTDAATGDRLIAADDLGGFAALGQVETVRHEDRYFDTADGALAAYGYAARLRGDGGRTVVTLKGLRRQDDGGRAHRRAELEGPADPELPASA